MILYLVEAESLRDVLETAVNCGAPDIIRDVLKKVDQELTLLRFEEECRRAKEGPRYPAKEYHSDEPEERV